jgi:hypothetical protein
MPVHSTTPKHHHPPPRRSRRFRPAALIILGFATLGCSDPAGIAAQPAPTPTTVSTAAPAATTAPPATTAAPTTTPKVEVPRLVGMKLASARQRLASHGLKLRVRYRPTARFAAGTVISQSRRIGAGVARSSAITLVIAKALPPPPTTQPHPHRRRLRGAVTPPTKAPASTPPPPTTTAPEAPETAPSTSRARSGSTLPTPTTSTPTTTASAANPTDDQPPGPPLTFAWHDGATVPPGVVRKVLVPQVGLSVQEALKCLRTIRWAAW